MDAKITTYAQVTPVSDLVSQAFSLLHMLDEEFDGCESPETAHIAEICEALQVEPPRGKRALAQWRQELVSSLYDGYSALALAQTGEHFHEDTVAQVTGA